MQPDAVVGAVIGQQGQGGEGQGGQFHRLVRGGDPGGLLELGVETGKEAAFVLGGDVQGAAGRDEGQEFLTQPAFERRQGNDTVRGNTRQGVPAGGQEDAVRRAADGPTDAGSTSAPSTVMVGASSSPPSSRLGPASSPPVSAYRPRFSPTAAG